MGGYLQVGPKRQFGMRSSDHEKNMRLISPWNNGVDFQKIGTQIYFGALELRKLNKISFGIMLNFTTKIYNLLTKYIYRS